MSKSFAVRKDATEWARHMEVRADRRDLPEDPKQLQRVTLGDLVRRYRDEVSIGKRGRDIETGFLNVFLRHPICARRLSEVRTEDFAQYRDERLKSIKPSSLKRQLDPIHNLFELAKREWGMPLPVNPLTALRLLAPSTRRERRLNVGEWEKLLNAARAARNPFVEPIIRLARETGMRRGELLDIERKHVDVERRSLNIPMTKNGHARTIPLTLQAIAILRQHQRDGRLFPITRNAFRLAWERVRQRAGVQDLRFHDLRHEAISRLFELGLTELVHQPTLERSLKAQKQRAQGKEPEKGEVYFVWGRGELLRALQARIDAKDKATLKGGPYDRYILVMHTDEMFLEAAKVKQWLMFATFRASHITDVFLGLSYEPDQKCCPVFKLRLDRYAHAVE